MWVFLIAALCAADGPSELTPSLSRARQDLEIVRRQAADGLVAASAVAQAEEKVADATDQVILGRTLYGRIQIENLTPEQANEMVSAAGRRVERVRRKLDEIQKLIDAGVAERNRGVELAAELDSRMKELAEAKARADLVSELAAMARAETEQPGFSMRSPAARGTKERFDGDHSLTESEIRRITLAFEKRFREPLPVSARGETAVHRAMGFDHTGRVDVALFPDSPEGVWLRSYLESRDIPYYAFRAAVPGKATAPHIHIGPPSTHLRLAD